MKLSRKLKNKLKTRLISAMVLVATAVLVFVCSGIDVSVEKIISAVNSENKMAVENSSVDVVKDSTGISIKVNAKNDSGVNKIEVLQGLTAVQTYNYSGANTEEDVSTSVSIPFGETKSYTVKVNDVVVEQKDITNMRCISTAADLVAFRNAVNGGNNFSGKYVELVNDIDLSSVCSSSKGSWVPIGKMESPSNLGNYYYAGTFNGNYHKISNLYINQSSIHYSGLFGYVNSCKIYNLIMQNVSIYNGYNSTVSNQTRTGSIAALVSSSSIIRNCGVESGSIQAKYTLTPGSWNLASVGGIVGASYTSVIEGCYNKATVTSTKNNSSGCQNRVAGISGDVASRNINKQLL